MDLNHNNRAAGARRWATPALFALLFTLGLAAVATTRSSPVVPAEVRIVRVTAADIARLPAGESYVVDLTKKDIAYDFDGRERAIDWSRVRIRDAAGEKSLNDWLKPRAPKRAAAPFKHFGVGTTEGVAKIFDFKANGKPGTKYECGPDVNTGDTFCGCEGFADCLNMLTSGACDGAAECTEDGCTCAF